MLTPKRSSQTPRTEWVLNWPGQVVIAGCQVYWTTEVTQAINDADIPGMFQNLMNQLSDLVTLVRGNLTAIARAVLSALIVIEVTPFKDFNSSKIQITNVLDIVQ